jgi:hypothetical protein
MIRGSGHNCFHVVIRINVCEALYKPSKNLANVCLCLCANVRKKENLCTCEKFMMLAFLHPPQISAKVKKTCTSTSTALMFSWHSA